jgi:NAD-dependent deacetylase
MVKKGQPKCPNCDGRLISSVVGFGDPMPIKETRLAMERSRTCDLFIVIGSSLVVRPAADMPLYALEAGAKLILINMGNTPLDNLEYLQIEGKKVHLRIEGKAGEIMPKIMAKVKEAYYVETRFQK